MGIIAKLGGFSTEFSGSPNRVSNVRRAATILNNTLIAPGQEFDFDSVVGERTVARGFKTAPAIMRPARGHPWRRHLPGGHHALQCRVLRRSRRHRAHQPLAVHQPLPQGPRRHRQLGRTGSPLGQRHAQLGADPNGVLRQQPDVLDLRHPAGPQGHLHHQRLVRHRTGGRSKKIDIATLPSGKTEVKDSGQTGRSVTVKRTVTQDGKVIHQDTFASRYPMYPRLVNVGRGYDHHHGQAHDDDQAAHRHDDHQATDDDHDRGALVPAPPSSAQRPLPPDTLRESSGCAGLLKFLLSVADSPAEEDRARAEVGPYERIASLGVGRAHPADGHRGATSRSSPSGRRRTTRPRSPTSTVSTSPKSSRSSTFASAAAKTPRT